MFPGIPVLRDRLTSAPPFHPARDPYGPKILNGGIDIVVIELGAAAGTDIVVLGLVVQRKAADGTRALHCPSASSAVSSSICAMERA